MMIEEGSQGQGQDIITDFIYGLGDRTKGQYLSRLAVFFNFLDIRPTEEATSAADRLEMQAALFLNEIKINGKEWVQRSLMRFIGHLNEKVKEGKFGRGTIRNYYKTVKRFCDSQEIELSWKRVASGLGKARRVANDRAPTLEEIQRLIQYPDRRIKPIVCVMVSSGIRIGAWEYLRWKHIKPLDKNGQPVEKDLPARDDGRIAAAKISVYGGEEEEYFSFITPEAYQSLKEWMDFRAANGEDINGESPLMRDIFPFKYGRSTAQNPTMILVESIWKIIEHGLKEQGIRKPLVKGAKRYEFQGAHGFRKYFKTRAEQAGMLPFNVETLMNHSLGISDHYGRPTEYDLFKDYLKAVDNLTITINRTNSQQELRQLTTKIQSKEQQIDELQEQIKNIQQTHLERNNTIQVLQQELRSWESIAEKMKVYIDRQKKQEAMMKYFMDEHRWYVSKYGLSDRQRNSLEEHLERIKDLPDDDNKLDEDASANISNSGIVGVEAKSKDRAESKTKAKLIRQISRDLFKQAKVKGRH